MTFVDDNVWERDGLTADAACPALRGSPGERFSPGLCCAIFDGGFAGDELSCSRGAVPVFLRTKQVLKRRAGLFAQSARVGLSEHQ